MDVRQVAERLTKETVADFFSKNRDLIACLNQDIAAVEEATTASAMLNRGFREEMTSLMEIIVQPNDYARSVGQKDFKEALYSAMAQSFLKCLNNRSLTYAIKATIEADEQYQRLKWAAGVEKAPAPPPAPLSAKEQLENEVVADFNGGLSGDKMRVKLNANRAYRETYERLAASDKLASRCTSLHDAGREIRG